MTTATLASTTMTVPRPKAKSSYNSEEQAFLKGVENYRSRQGKPFLTAIDYLIVAKDLGYQQVGFSA